MSRSYRPSRRRAAHSHLRTRRRRRQTFEALEKRLLLADDFFLLPGAAGEAVDLEFRWKSRDADYNNEVGVFVVQDEQGVVDGIAPGSSSYAETALTSAASHVVFASGQGAGVRRELSFAGGDRLAFYLVQNNTTDTLLAQNAQNVAAQRPIAFFSVDTANPDGFDHVRSRQRSSGVWEFMWEDVTGGGDRDFNDVVFTVMVVEAPPEDQQPPVHEAQPAVGLPLIVPGQSWQTVSTTFTWVSRDADYNNELGLFVVDDATGRIGDLSPGDAGYAQAAMSSPGQQVVFASGQTRGAVTQMELPGGSCVGLYLVQNATTQSLLQQNPSNQVGGRPVAFFSFASASPDGIEHIRQLSGGRFGCEDLLGGGDRDYNDMVFRVQFGTPQGVDNQPPTVVIQSPEAGLTTDTNVTVAGQVSDDLSGVASLECQVDSGSFFDVSFDELGSFSFETTLPLDGSADGEHTVRLRATDQAGNVSDFVEVTFTLERAGANRAITTDEGVQQMPSIAVNPLDSNHLVIAYMDYSLVDTGYAGIGVAVSHDAGTTWDHSSIPVPEPFNEGAANPIVKFDDQGQVFVSFMAATFLGERPPLTNPTFALRGLGMQANNGVFVARSEDGGLNWNEPVAVVSHLYDGENDVPFEVIPDLAIDIFPQLPVGQPNPYYGNLYVCWTRLYPPGQFPGEPESTGGGDIMVAVSPDGGCTWETKLQEQDGSQVTVLQYPINFGNGVPIGRSVVDQSHLAMGPLGDIYVSALFGGNFTVHHSTDGGASFAEPDLESGRRHVFGTDFNISVRGEGLPNNRFRTHSVRAVAADLTRLGHVYAAEPVRVRDRLGDEIDGADVFFGRSADSGETWDAAFTVGPNAATILNDDNDGQSATGFAEDEVISGQALARLAVDVQGNIGVIWYDTRRDPADHLLDVFGTVSTDGGETFSANFRITDVSFDADEGSFTNATGGEDFYLSDFLGLAMANNSGYAAWTDTRNGNQDVFFASFPIDPAPDPPNDRFEPNDTAQLTTSPTELGRVVKRRLPKLHIGPGDEDWFLLEAAASGELSATALASEFGDRLDLELWNKEATSLLATGVNLVDDAGIVTGERLIFATSAGQEFLVHVLPSAASEGTRYCLELQSLTADLGTRVHGLVDGTIAAGDEAFYLLEAGASGSWEIEVTSEGNMQGNLDLQVLDADDLSVLATGEASGGPGPGEVERVSLPVRRNQALLIHVSGDPGTLGDFVLEFTNLDQFTTGENDQFFFPAGAGPSELILGDLNADGKQDLVVTDALSSTISVLLGNGDGTFQSPFQFDVGAFTSPNPVKNNLSNFGRHAAIADFNRDAIPDVVVTNYDSSDVSVLLGHGDGTFEPQRRFDATQTPFTLEVGDMNGDGLLDLVVVDSNLGPSTAAVLLGRGDGTFQPQHTFAAPIGSGFPETAVRVADLDGDGVNDLVMSGDNEPFVHVLQGRGDGTFVTMGSFRVARSGTGLEVTDLDGDGNLDIVTTGVISINTVSVLFGNGDGTFKEFQEFLAGQLPVDLAVVDFGSQTELPNGSTSLGPPDGKPDLVVSASGIVTFAQAVGESEVVVLPGVFDDQGAFVEFGSPQRIASGKVPTSLDAADVNGDGAVDIAVVDTDGVLVIFGEAPNILPNNTPEAARDLGTVVHLVDQTQTIVPGHEDAYYKLTVPTEAIDGGGDEIIDFSLLFQHTEGPGLGAEVLDAAGNLLGSGERFRVRAKQGEDLTLHVFGVEDPSPQPLSPTGRGAGAYTLVIDVLPQVVSVESQALLPGVGENPGGPTTSLVLTFQGDRLDPATAEDPDNYTVTWLGPDRLAGTADDQVIPVGGAEIDQPVVYNPGANVEPTSGRTYATAVRQTVTLLFADALPVGSYLVELSPGVQTAAFNEQEAGLLAGGSAFTGHPMVSLEAGQLVEGSRAAAVDLVLESVALGDLSVFNQGTPFLTQLHDDLGALLDALLTELGDDPSITPALVDQVIARVDPALGPVGQRTAKAMVIWLDPVSIDIEDPGDEHIIYDPEEDIVISEPEVAYVDVSDNIEVVVISEPYDDPYEEPPEEGEYAMSVAYVPETARGGVIMFSADTTEYEELTEELRDGVTTFTFTF